MYVDLKSVQLNVFYMHLLPKQEAQPTRLQQKMYSGVRVAELSIRQIKSRNDEE